MIRRASLILLSTMMLISCGSDDEQSASAASGPGPAELRVAANSAPGTPWHDMWVRFEQGLAQQAPEAIDLQLFVTGQLGGEEATLSSLRRGRIQMGGYSLQGASSIVPELSMILAPYLFNSPAEVDFVMDQYLNELVAELFADKGLHFVQWAEVGWTHVFSREPILMPDDARGEPLRASTAPGARAFGKAIGSDLISIPFPEIVPGLQTGLIEGGQSGIGMYALTGIAKEAPHLTLTAHAFDTGVVLINKKWWDALPESSQAAIRASLDEVQFSRRDVRRVIADIQQRQLAELGVTVHELNDAQRQAWRDAADQTHVELVADVGGRAQEMYDAIIAGKRAFAASQQE